MTRYLTVGEVITINETEVGPDLLADFGLLESGVLRPAQSLFGQDAYPDIHLKAAALLHSIARNHAFVDGNKRTALLAAVIFYARNGYALDADDGDLVALVLDAAQGLIDVDGIAAQMKNWVRKIEYPDPE